MVKTAKVRSFLILIGYGSDTIKYADGTTREFYQIGLSANKTGISVYILGIEDKKYLAEVYGKDLGKASVTGYCIRFKTLKKTGEVLVPDAALQALALEGYQFNVIGKSTYEQQIASLRDIVPAAV